MQQNSTYSFSGFSGDYSTTSDVAWKTVTKLKYHCNFLNREIRIALHRKYINKYGDIDIDYNYEKMNANVAWLFIFVIVFTAVFWLFLIPNYLITGVPDLIIIGQLVIYSIITIVFMATLAGLALLVFVRNIYPLEIISRIEKRTWKLEDEGIGVLIR